MSLSTWEGFKVLFAVCCVASTIYTFSWQISKYSKNEEVTEVSFRPFHVNEDDLYPSVSLCFASRFDDNLLGMYGEGINSESYAKFLQGNFWNPDLVNVSLENITMDVMPYILSIGGVLSSWEWVWYYNKTSNESQKSSTMSTQTIPGPMLASSCYTCLTIDVPFQRNLKLKLVWLAIRTNIFPNRIRPHSNGFLVMFHYPNQFIRSAYSLQSAWPIRGENSSKSYQMLFTITSMEIGQRRSDGQSPCNADVSNSDTALKHRIVASEGCKPPYWSQISNLPQCWKMKQMKAINSKIHEAMQFDDEIQPCRSLETLQYDMIDIDEEEEAKEPSIKVLIYYKIFTYKQIKRVRAMDMQTFIGIV